MARSSTIPNKVYKFVHFEDVYIRTNLTGRAVQFEWLEIDDEGKITVKGSHPGGYAWDGCSPKFIVLDLIFGTPDGKLDYATDKQIAYYASMIHDALYQFKSEINISRKETDLIFKRNLKKAGFKLAGVYYFFVRLFGGFYGKWKVKKSQKNVRVAEFSWLMAENH